MLALIVAARFGMLLGLALWLGLGVALLMGLPIIERKLPPAQARELSGTLVARMDWMLVGAAALVLIGLGSRVLIDRAAPPTSIVAPVALMVVCRLVSIVARPQEQFRRMLLTLEVCLGLYALYSVS